MKKFIVNIDMKYSKEFIISAKNIKDAKEKSWSRFKRNPSKKNFSFFIDIINQ